MADKLLSEMLKLSAVEYHLIPLTNWRARVIILIGGTHEQHIDAFKRNKLPKSEQDNMADYIRDQMRTTAGVTLQSSYRPRRQFIYFAKRPDVSHGEVANVVAHELLHATIHILKHANMRLNEGSEEAYTYLLGYLVEQFWLKVPPQKVYRPNVNSPAK